MLPTFSDSHDLDAVAGTSFQDQRIFSTSAEAEGFPSEAYRKLAQCCYKIRRFFF